MHRLLCSWIKGSCLGVRGLPPLVHLPALWGRQLGKDMLVLASGAKLACAKMDRARGHGLATAASGTDPQAQSPGGKNRLDGIPDTS